MIALIGLLVVTGAVIGGFTMGGGQVMSLFHLSEIVVIAGTSLGTVLVSAPLPAIMALTRKLPQLIQPSPFSKALYLDALKMMYELFQIARKDGLVAIESHIEAPEKSAVFKKYPALLKNHHAIVFLCDSLRLVLVGSVPPHDLEALMDTEIEVHHHAEMQPIGILTKVSDGLPGIGIVAAVLGIVITMGAIAGPITQIGEHVAAALSGTFLGVLIAYGFVGPMAGGLEAILDAESRYYYFLKASVIAFAKGFPPIVAVEFSRREIYADNRPSFAEMETACKALKSKAA